MSRIWLPFTPGKLPIVTVRIGTERYRALVDTGAAISLIEPEIAVVLGLQMRGWQPLVGVTGQKEMVEIVQLPTIGFSGIELSPCRAVVQELAPLGLKIELILGVNAFAAHRLQFDFREGRIYIVE
jgi:predicted aspartyl protease